MGQPYSVAALFFLENDMHTLDISSIIVPDGRQRTAFNEKQLDELKASLSKFIIHPITVTSLDEKVLIAGERRLRCAKALADEGIALTFMGEQLPLGHVPVLPFNQVDASLIYEAELVENINRADLTWQEKALAVARLHDLQKGAAAATSSPAPTLLDTARAALKKSEVSVAERKEVAALVHLGNAIENDYELAMAKSESDALKIIKNREKKEQRKRLSILADTMSLGCDLRKGDSFELVKTIPDNSIDVVITDPPYGIEMGEKGTWSVDNHDYDDSAAMINRIANELPTALYRVMKDGSHGYVFCDWRYFDKLSVAFALEGFIVWQRPIIWYKGSIGAFVDAKHGPRYTYEMLLYIRKGERHIDRIYDDVISINQSTHHAHPAGKPPELFKFLLDRSGLPGQTCLDMFAGGGPLIPAAHEAKMKSICFEMNDTYFDMCRERISELK